MDDLERLEASRGKFLAAAGITGAALAAGAWKTKTAGAALPTRSYAASHFAIELEGVSAGFVKSVDGGGIVGEVVNEPGSATYYQKKHIGNVTYGEFTVRLGLSMAKSVYDWISASLVGTYERKSGAVVAADFDYKERARREFHDALITEIGFPALDASSKDPAYLALTFAPDLTRRKAGSGAKLQAPATQKQKQWLASAFRVEVAGMPTGKVSKVDAFTIKQTAVTDEVGEARLSTKEPGKLEFPNLKITVAETDAGPWEAWHEDFVVNGNNEESKEKSGAIVFLSPDRQDELARVVLHGVGIVSVEPEQGDAAGDTIRRIKAELYCERMEFSTGGKPPG
jgi:hypothetical protein